MRNLKYDLRCVALTCATLGALARPALAQPPPDTQGAPPGAQAAPPEHRRTRLVFDELAPQRGGEPPELIVHRSQADESWRVTIRQRERAGVQELSTLTMAEWIGKPYYDYSVRVYPAQKERQHYALFEAEPVTARGAPPAATTLQMAWLVETPPRGTSRWKYITRAKHSDLDPGEQLRIEERADGTFGLRRRRPQLGKRFCGLGPDEIIESEYFAPDKGIFIVEMDVDQLTRGAGSIQAYLPIDPFEPEELWGYTLWRAATSDLRTPTDTSTVLRPLELGDKVLDTVWSEGAPGPGRGEFVSARIEPSIPLKGFRIFPGNGERPDTYARWPRPMRLLIGLSSGERYFVDLPDADYTDLASKNGLLVELPTPRHTECLSVMLLEAYDPIAPPPRRRDFSNDRAFRQAQARYGSVAIAELTPLSILHGLKPSSAAQAILELLYEESDGQRRRRLGMMTRAYSQYLLEELRARISQPEGMVKLDHAASLLASMPSEEALPLLMELVARVNTKTSSYRALRRAIAAHREVAAEPLLEMLAEMTDEVSERKRVDMIRLLGRVGEPEHLERLLARMGQGSPAERDERARAVSAGELAMVTPLLELAAAQLQTPAGTDALKALDTIGQRLLIEPELEPRQRELLLELTDMAQGRRTTMRLIRLLSHFEPEGAEPLISRMLTSRPDPMIRREAARALAHFDGEVSRRALERALEDPSPDVRIDAIRALTPRPDAAESTPHLLAYITRERWTEGLRPALQLLATIDDVPSVEGALHTMILDRSAPDHAYLAAQAYERARRPLDPAVVDVLLFEPETSFQMRRQLIEALAQGSAEAGESLLLRVLTDDPFRALETPRRVAQLEAEAILALGQRRSPRAQKLLLEMAAEAPSVKRRLTALRALSFYADEVLLDHLTAMRPGAPPQVREAVDETHSIISRRLDIRGARQAIEDFEDKERERQKQREQRQTEPPPPLRPPTFNELD